MLGDSTVPPGVCTRNRPDKPALETRRTTICVSLRDSPKFASGNAGWLFGPRVRLTGMVMATPVTKRRPVIVMFVWDVAWAGAVLITGGGTTVMALIVNWLLLSTRTGPVTASVGICAIGIKSCVAVVFCGVTVTAAVRPPMF